jgi:hypothetical protein
MLLHPDNGQATGEIWVMRADGGDLKRLTENPWEDATPAWKPLNKQRHDHHSFMRPTSGGLELRGDLSQR